jgi:hypothetical protein
MRNKALPGLIKKSPLNQGEGFMHPPYKEPNPWGPYEKRQGYHGFKNFKSNIEHDDQSKESAKKRGELCPKCGKRKGNCVCK